MCSIHTWAIMQIYIWTQIAFERLKPWSLFYCEGDDAGTNLKADWIFPSGLRNHLQWKAKRRKPVPLDSALYNISCSSTAQLLLVSLSDAIRWENSLIDSHWRKLTNIAATAKNHLRKPPAHIICATCCGGKGHRRLIRSFFFTNPKELKGDMISVM